MTDNDLMPFGKYKGTKMANVPAKYLLWCRTGISRNVYTASVLDYIEENLDVLEGEIKEDE